MAFNRLRKLLTSSLFPLVNDMAESVSLRSVALQEGKHDFTGMLGVQCGVALFEKLIDFRIAPAIPYRRLLHVLLDFSELVEVVSVLHSLVPYWLFTL